MTHLIDKDAIVAEIERRIEELQTYIKDKEKPDLAAIFLAGNCIKECKSILSFINSLEKKEVDLKKEIASYIHDNTINGYFRADIHDVAEYFFELGLKAQKGE